MFRLLNRLCRRLVRRGRSRKDHAHTSQSAKTGRSGKATPFLPSLNARGPGQGLRKLRADFFYGMWVFLRAFPGLELHLFDQDRSKFVFRNVRFDYFVSKVCFDFSLKMPGANEKCKKSNIAAIPYIV